MTTTDLPVPPLQVVRHPNGALLLVSFVTYGTPAPQGSKKAFVNRHTGRVNMRESSKKVQPWREAIKATVTSETGGTVLFAKPLPVVVAFDFYLLRPAGHYGTGKNACVLKAGAPVFPTGMPDADKLARSSSDALTDSGVVGDDAQIVRLVVSKNYVHEGFPIPGARITVSLAGGASC